MNTTSRFGSPAMAWRAAFGAMLRRWRAGAAWVLAGVLCLALAGCGGGGSSDPEPTRIGTQPASAAVAAGGAVTWAATASGDNLSYQWQRSIDAGVNWLALAGATAASYTIPVVDASMNGQQFRVVITGSAGSVTSSAVTLTVTPAPVAVAIVVQPADQVAVAGADASFAVTASGTSPAYQWQSSPDNTTWANVNGATSATLNLPAVGVGVNGTRYRVVVSNSLNSVTSRAALLGVSPPANTAPQITTQPLSATVVSPQTASFTVAATGTPAPSYQWQQGSGGTFADIPGATAASYTTPATATADSGRQYRVRVSNSAGTVTSDAATLTVTPGAVAPTITRDPLDRSVTAPEAGIFTVVVTGSPAPSYQWQLSSDGGATFVNINGATAGNYTTPATVSGDSGNRYRVVVSNSAGSATSRAAVLTVVAAPGGSTPGAAAQCARYGLLSTGTTVEVVTASSGNATLRQTTRATVVGPAPFQGNTVTRIDAVASDNQSGGSSTIQLYVSWNAATGALTQYGTILDGTLQAGPTTVVTHQTAVYTPPFVDATYTLNVGGSLTQTSAQQISGTTTINGVAQPPQNTTSSTTSTITFAGFETVTTPAGTFNTCKFTESTAGEAGTSTSWVARDYGFEVKSTASNGNTQTAVSVKVNGVVYP
jgi:hypothetical protein